MEETHNLPLSLWGEQSMAALDRSNFLSLLVGSTQFHFPPSSLCTLTTFTLPHLKHVWTAHTATISSCPGVKGGLLLPWLPHTPLLHDNNTGLLTISLSMQVSLVPFDWNQEWKHKLVQVPVPDGAIPELLVWAPPNCTLSLSLSPSFFPLAGKLFVLYTPLLLPWITAVTLSSGSLLGELVLLAVMWGATS